MDSLHPRGAYRAILGADLFSGTTLTFDFGRRRLGIDESASPSADARDPREIDPWLQRAGTLPLVRVAGMLLVPVTIETGSTRLERLMLFDTGASRTLLDAGTATLFPEMRRGAPGRARGYGGAISVVGRLPALHITAGRSGGQVRDVPVLDLSARARLTGIHVGGFLGNDWLARRRATVDLGRGEIRIEDGGPVRRGARRTRRR